MRRFLLLLGFLGGVSFGFGFLLAASFHAYGQGSPAQLYCNNGGTGFTQWTPCLPANPLSVTGTVTSSIAFTGATTTQTKVTIAATNTYQTALASSSTRKGCTLQYIAVAGSTGYVYFGTAPADTTTSWQLKNGQPITCAIAGIGVATDAITITGTQNDIFIVSNQ